MLFVESSSKKLLKKISFFLYPNCEWTHLELPFSFCQAHLELFVFFSLNSTLFFPLCQKCHFMASPIQLQVDKRLRWKKNLGIDPIFVEKWKKKKTQRNIANVCHLSSTTRTHTKRKRKRNYGKINCPT